MHELSIAQNIIEIVKTNIPEPEWGLVASVNIKVGEVAGVVPESLEFSFHAITADTPLSQTQLKIDFVPFRIHCNKCGEMTGNEAGFAICEKCGSPDTKTISGSELQITGIEILEPEEELK
jgi:hydrogenase nickel incorporation protein HypA/HybF